MIRKSIELTKAEIATGYDRVQFAEDLIKQLPKDHDGRNTWLMNYGTQDEAQELRKYEQRANSR